MPHTNRHSYPACVAPTVREWVEIESSADIARRDNRWFEPIAVGSEGFIEQVKNELDFRAQHRQLAVVDGLYSSRTGARLMATISIGKMSL
jgi:hypothetical protein